MMQTIAYGPDPRQVVGVFHYNPEFTLEPAIAFIHGGAWVDESNSYMDWAAMASHFSERYPRRNIFGINYRLLPMVVHPAHVQDVFMALNMLSVEKGCKSILLIGHLVGATLAFQMLTPSRIWAQDARTGNPQFSIDSIVLLDGIYDVTQLISEYPGYCSFVDKAFKTPQEYACATAISDNFDGKFDLIPRKVTLMYSLQDELLSPMQAKLMTSFLQQQGVEYTLIEDNWGSHDDMYKNPTVCELVAAAVL